MPVLYDSLLLSRHFFTKRTAEQPDTLLLLFWKYFISNRVEALEESCWVSRLIYVKVMFIICIGIKGAKKLIHLSIVTLF